MADPTNTNPDSRDPNDDIDASAEPVNDSGQGVPSHLKQSAAMNVLQKTGRAFKSTAKTAKKEKDKTVLIIAVLALVILGGAIGVALVAKKDAPRTIATKTIPQFSSDMTIVEEVRGWKNKTAQQINDISGQMVQMQQAVEAISKRQNESDKFLKDTLGQVTADFQRIADQKLKAVDEIARSAGTPSASEVRTAAIVEKFRRDLLDAKLSPQEARARAAQLLRDANYPEDRIRDMLADAAVQVGRLSAGNIEEPALTPEESAIAPEWIRPHLGGLRDLVYGLAVSTGRLYPEQVYPEVTDFMKATGGQARMTEITPALVQTVANIVRVRRENLTNEQEAALPLLVTLRDEAKIDRNDRKAIAQLVWNARDRYKGATPGQMLSLSQIVARTIGGSAKGVGEQPAFRSLDEEGEKFATEVLIGAAATSVQLGRTQDEQYKTCERALDNYLDTARYKATPEQRKTLILRAMSQAVKRAKRPELTEPAQPAENQPTGRIAAPVRDDKHLYFGTLKVERGRAVRALVFAVPTLARSSGLEPGSVGWAAAVVTGWEQSPRLVMKDLPASAGRPMGGRDFMAAAMQELILVIRQGEVLSRIPLSVTGDPAKDKAPIADIMRGVTIGAIYGPLIHDEEKAKAVGADLLPMLQQNPPLTKELNERLSAVEPGKPFIALVGAYEGFRPGRFGYPADRFQELVGRMEALIGQVSSLRDMIAEQIRAEQVGIYEENIRLLIPLSVAAHDELNLPPEKVIEAVRKDIWQYTTVFLAEYQLGRAIAEAMIPRYAAAIASNDAGAGIVQRVMEYAAEAVSTRFKGTAEKITPESILQTAAEIAQGVMPDVERFVVTETVMSRVEPRVAAAVSDQSRRDVILEQVRARSAQVVTPAYTPARIDGWASQLTEEARRMIEQGGNTLSPPIGPGDAQGNPAAGKRNGLWPTPSMVQGIPTGQLIGTSTTMVRTRKVEIPAISYANAHLLSGVDAEIGGRTNLPIICNVTFAWSGPANSRLIMRNCRLSGTANAMAGPERVAIDLKRLSFVFPSGRSVNAEVNGFVADNLNGQYGALGTYKWNFEKVLPLAAVAGAGKGAADALKSSTQTTVVGITGATTAVSTGSQLKQALAGGVAGGFGIMSDYFKTVLDDVRPSVSAVNGQRVSVVLIDPVVIDVPESEFSYITEQGNGGFAP